jgi:DMSO/TMAO reductase YedYZ molybdopterin-dependent catalytic subunit
MFGDERRDLEKKAKADGRLPPGQSLTLNWPVLHAGGVPHFDPAKWDFKITGLVQEPNRLTWEEFRWLPQTEVTSDFHCVTRWSRLDNHWKGVLFTDVMKLVTVKPEAKFALVLAEEGYTANVPMEDLLRPNVLFAFDQMGSRSRRARWVFTVDRSAVVCVEEREVGARLHATRSRSTRLLGAQWLPRIRRSLERAALFGHMSNT